MKASSIETPIGTQTTTCMKYNAHPESLTHRDAHIAPDGLLPEARRAWEDAHIWKIFRHYSRTFSFATRLLPAPMRLPIATLYYFCRTIDNLADHARTPAERDAALKKLASARRALDRSLSGHPPPDSLMWRRLAEIHTRYTLHTPPLHELIDGAEWDLRGIHIRDEADLIRYADLVAGSIGAMMLPFLIDDRADLTRLETPARALGIAMQITNILRDVGEDARELQRIYLPESLRLAHGCPDIAPDGAGGIPEGYSELMEALMMLAEQYFVEGIAGIGSLNRSVRSGIGAAARMYREILNEIRARGYDNLSARAYTSGAKKLQLVFFDTYERRKRRLLTRRAAAPARLPA
ncbi:MAG: phytoene/squalene synthase family protein [Rhodothermales bacterium]